ncbi:MAG: hypothetical protein M0Z96_03960, partial [Actinomycetota bacterium]|nr:hypothetical protein [Actinomycetota bacterium]
MPDIVAITPPWLTARLGESGWVAMFARIGLHHVTRPIKRLPAGWAGQELAEPDLSRLQRSLPCK